MSSHGLLLSCNAVDHDLRSKLLQSIVLKREPSCVGCHNLLFVHAIDRDVGWAINDYHKKDQLALAVGAFIMISSTGRLFH